jgi:hypothetical protein
MNYNITTPSTIGKGEPENGHRISHGTRLYGVQQRCLQSRRGLPMEPHVSAVRKAVLLYCTRSQGSDPPWYSPASQKMSFDLYLSSIRCTNELLGSFFQSMIPSTNAWLYRL